MSLFIQRLTQLLCPELCQQLAQESGWCKRLGKINSFEFLFSLVFGQSSALALTLNAQATSVSRTAICLSFQLRSTKEAVFYF